MNRWHVVQTQAMAEAKACFHLERQGFSVYLPRYLKLRRHARKRDWVRAPLFPRYLFLSMDPNRTRWLSIRSTIGVSHLVCNGDRPAAVPAGVVEGIMARETSPGLIDLRQENRFQRGETVQITEGALCDRIGLFDCETDEERVVVLLDLLGREVRVTVPRETITDCQQ